MWRPYVSCMSRWGLGFKKLVASERRNWALGRGILKFGALAYHLVLQNKPFQDCTWRTTVDVVGWREYSRESRLEYGVRRFSQGI